MGVRDLSFVMLEGVCWMISSMGSSTKIGSWLVSTIGSCTIVFVWLLTRFQGASPALAKRETIIVYYILLGSIYSNSRLTWESGPGKGTVSGRVHRYALSSLYFDELMIIDDRASRRVFFRWRDFNCSGAIAPVFQNKDSINSCSITYSRSKTWVEGKSRRLGY